METNLIKEQIFQILEAINEQVIMIQKNKGRIPQIEIDLIKENIRALYNIMNLLDKNNNPVQQSESDIKNKTEQVIREKPEEKVPSEDSQPVKPAKELSEEKKPIAPREQPQKSKHEPEPREKTEPSTRSKQSLDLFSGQANGITIGDKLRDDQKSLNEKLQEEKKARTIADKMQDHKIHDLKASIGLNEKFLFIKELFNNNLNHYEENIHELNTCKNYHEALLLIEDLTEKNKWDTGSDAYSMMVDMVRRRYL